jgi:vibriolysin
VRPWHLLLFAALLVTGCEKLPAAPDPVHVPPTAAFFYSPVSPIYASLSPVTFNAEGSTDTDGQIVSYNWDFGDGTPPQAMTSPVIVHTFPDVSRCITITYGVSLRVVDNAGSQGVTSAQVTVTELPVPTDPACLPPAH